MRGALLYEVVLDPKSRPNLVSRFAFPVLLVIIVGHVLLSSLFSIINVTDEVCSAYHFNHNLMREAAKPVPALTDYESSLP